MATKKFLIRIRRNELGASMVEYALIAALVSLMGVASLQTVGTEVNKKICAAGDTLAGATGGRTDCEVLEERVDD